MKKTFTLAVAVFTLLSCNDNTTKTDTETTLQVDTTAPIQKTSAELNKIRGKVKTVHLTSYTDIYKNDKGEIVIKDTTNPNGSIEHYDKDGRLRSIAIIRAGMVVNTEKRIYSNNHDYAKTRTSDKLANHFGKEKRIDYGSLTFIDNYTSVDTTYPDKETMDIKSLQDTTIITITYDPKNSKETHHFITKNGATSSESIYHLVEETYGDSTRITGNYTVTANGKTTEHHYTDDKIILKKDAQGNALEMLMHRELDGRRQTELSVIKYEYHL